MAANAEEEAAVVGWIEKVTGSERGPLSTAEWLKDGQVLCNLVNTIKPGTIKKINKMMAPFKRMENIKQFCDAARSFGVHESSIFATADLFEEKNMNHVIHCLFTFAGTIQTTVPDYKGPQCGKPINDRPRQKSVMSQFGGVAAELEKKPADKPPQKQKSAVSNVSMQKNWDEDGIPLEDTNMAGVGGEEDKANRKNAAGHEPAWQGIGTVPGLWIFRIEAFKVKPWPKEQYGQFHEGDSYICLKASEVIEEETGQPSEKLDLDIHFWLGKKTSTDEKGTAAYKTVELDDFFDGIATQHRETQGNESEMFLELFPDGISYLPGGVESGFRATQVDIFMKKLYQVRRNAKKAIIVEEEPVKLESLNHRDSWILDAGRKIYVWHGDNSSPFIKHAANIRAEKLENDSNGEKNVAEVDDDFWESLGGKGPITPADEVGEELPPDFGEGILYTCAVEDGKLSVTEKGRGELERSMLDPTNVMLLDTRTEIFLWLGGEANNAEKRAALPTAVNYLKTNGRDPDKTSITILKQGHARKNKTWLAIFPL